MVVVLSVRGDWGDPPSPSSVFCIFLTYVPLQFLSPHVDKSIYPLIPLSLHNYFHPAPIFRWVFVPCFSDTSNFKRTGIAAQFLLIFSSEISTKHLQSTCTYHFANCAVSTLSKKIWIINTYFLIFKSSALTQRNMNTTPVMLSYPFFCHLEQSILLHNILTKITQSSVLGSQLLRSTKVISNNNIHFEI